MTIRALGHWKGDPTRHCERLTVETDDPAEAVELALLLRVLSDPGQRARLLELAERVECESAEAVELVGN